MNFSKIKMMFFDFDDTLLIHYREQRLDSTGEAHRERLRENRVKRGTQYAKFAFYRTANRLNQYYKTATGQRVAKRVNDGDFPYNVYDANGGIVKPETKKAKKVV